MPAASTEPYDLKKRIDLSRNSEAALSLLKSISEVYE